MCSSIEVSPIPYIRKIKWIIETRKSCIKAYRDAELVYLRAKGKKRFFGLGRLLNDDELIKRYTDSWSRYYEISWGGDYELRNLLTMLQNTIYHEKARLSKDDVNFVDRQFNHWTETNKEFGTCCEVYYG